LQHRTALQEELSSQLAQMAGQLRRNAEHFSTALAADQAVLSNAEEKIGANFDVMKQERVRLRDHRSRSLGTTCLTITSVLMVSIAFVIMLFIFRLT
jgi:SNARE protein 1